MRVEITDFGRLRDVGFTTTARILWFVLHRDMHTAEPIRDPAPSPKRDVGSGVLMSRIDLACSAAEEIYQAISWALRAKNNSLTLNDYVMGGSGKTTPTVRLDRSYAHYERYPAFSGIHWVGNDHAFPSAGQIFRTTAVHALKSPAVLHGIYSASTQNLIALMPQRDVVALPTPLLTKGHPNAEWAIQQLVVHIGDDGKVSVTDGPSFIPAHG